MSTLYTSVNLCVNYIRLYFMYSKTSHLCLNGLTVVYASSDREHYVGCIQWYMLVQIENTMWVVYSGIC